MKDYLMTTYHPAISARAERQIRLAAIVMMLLVAASAVVLSFDGLRNLAVDNRVPEHLAFLFPIIIDGTITMSSLAILRMNLGGQKATFGWFVMFFGVGLSIAGNAISVRDAGVIAMLVHALPPILLAISLELLLSLIRANIKASRELASRPVGVVSDDVAVDAAVLPGRTDEKPVADVSESDPVPSLQETASSSVEHVQPGAVEEPVKTPVEFSEARANREYPQLSVMAEPVVKEPSVQITDSDALMDDTAEDTAAEDAVLEPGAPDVDDTQGDDDDFDDLFNQTVAESDNNTVSPDRSGSTVVEAADPEDGRLSGDKSEPEMDAMERYRQIVEGREEWPRAKKLFAILAMHPDAKVNDIKRALGDKGNVSYSDDLAVARRALKKKKMSTRKVKS